MSFSTSKAFSAFVRARKNLAFVFYAYDQKYEQKYSLKITYVGVLKFSAKGSLWCIDPAYRPNLVQALKRSPYYPYLHPTGMGQPLSLNNLANLLPGYVNFLIFVLDEWMNETTLFASIHKQEGATLGKKKENKSFTNRR